MGKSKSPRKPPKRTRRKAASRANTELVPTARRAPAAARADAPERQRPAADRLLRLLRTAVTALLDIADAAAATITRGRGRRHPQD